jgi:DNA helicase-2/ATP-dependent DNA helicase PcrA
MSQKKELAGAFASAYAELNPEQRQAVDTIEGPVLVVAGPGTGKTQILTLRIANILRQTDAQPENILALTFTESGAKAMRDRLRRFLGSDAYRVGIFTFHGLANYLISQYPDAYPHIAGGRPVTDIEQLHLIESILNDTDISALRPTGNPTFYVSHLIRTIGTLKQENVTPTGLRELVASQEATLAAMSQYHESGAHKGKVRSEYTKLKGYITKNHELAHVYQRYQAALYDSHWYDFNDMLLDTVVALQQNEDMLRDVQETYQYVLADEHQDVNGVQNTLLEQLVSYHQSPNIFAVGDEKQAIYRFQGASLENFLKFTDVFPTTKTISLTQNYRSGQCILDAAHDLVAVEDGPLHDLRIPLEAAAVTEATVSSHVFHHQAVEDDWLVQSVQEALLSGTPANEVAVIVRTNREVEHVAGLLRGRGVSVAASADGDILAHPITQAVETLLSVVMNAADSVALSRLLLAPYWTITQTDRARLLAAQRHDRMLVTLLSDAAARSDLDLTDDAAITKLWQTIVDAQAVSTTQPPHRVLQQLLKQSGLLDYLITHDPIEGVRVVRRLYDEVESLVRHGGVATVADVAAALKTRRSYGLPLTAPYINAGTDAVQVMTAHKSKGLEFSTVLLPYLTDRTWGGAAKPTYFSIPLVRKEIADAIEPLDDERRLLFVALTRARTQLLLSSSEQGIDGAERSTSRLVADIDTALLPVVDTTPQADTFAPETSLMGVVAEQVFDTNLVATLFSERGFSATSFNNYLESPWLYLGRNLLRIPEVQGLPLLYGTAVHNVIERMTRAHHQHGTLPAIHEVQTWLHTELSRLPVSTVEYTQLHERALSALTIYQEHLGKSLPARTREEVKLSVVLETGLTDCPEVVLTGKLDRLDYNELGQLMRVVDYKTGKPKTRNAIEGKTKSDDGGYKRQLIFYALLLELAGDTEQMTRTMTLSFVEPTAKGEIQEETFTITDEEIATLKSQILTAAEALTSGTWQTAPCDPAVVEYCHLLQPKTTPAA